VGSPEIVVGDPGSDLGAGVVEVEEQGFVEQLIAHSACKNYHARDSDGSHPVDVWAIARLQARARSVLAAHLKRILLSLHSFIQLGAQLLRDPSFLAEPRSLTEARFIAIHRPSGFVSPGSPGGSVKIITYSLNHFSEGCSQFTPSRVLHRVHTPNQSQMTISDLLSIKAVLRHSLDKNPRELRIICVLPW
jgi:hypothetical protein